ncbi:MAG: hypothetical protein KAI43_10510 [Candidatus Aureabacteria bacterium]|nr:hypothetical protein [Candidatus Auribacterota bacterium]
MAEGEILKSCPYKEDTFLQDQLVKMPAFIKSIKKDYCEGNFIECARYMVLKALGEENIPANLFPNDQKGAKEIILKGKPFSKE